MSARLAARLAIADLRHQPIPLLCNIAMILGVVVPLLTMLGVKNGFTDQLMARLNSDPAILQLTTGGNADVPLEHYQAIADLPQVIYVTYLTRSQSNFLRVRPEGPGRTRNARLVASGAGDPILGALAPPSGTDVVLSTDMAALLEVDVGTALRAATDVPGRPRQGQTQLTVTGILPPEVLEGDAMLVDLALLDALEAFDEGYAVPSLGIAEGTDPATRTTSYEGLRVNVASLEDVGPVSESMSDILGRNINSSELRIGQTLNIIRLLNSAFTVIVLIAVVGVAAALVGSLYDGVTRKRGTLAMLSLMGTDPRSLLAFPAVQALVTVGAGLLLALLCYVPVSLLAARLLQSGSGEGSGFLALTLGNLGLVFLVSFVIAALATLLGARQTMRIDPAIVLREAT